MHSSTEGIFYHLKAELSSSCHVQTLSVAKTVLCMIIYHTSGLHIRIHDDRSDESKPSLFHVFAQLVRNVAGRRNIAHRAPIVLYGLAVDEVPYIG